MSSTMAEPRAVALSPVSHPAFCEGGIACERSNGRDWAHEGRETTWHAGDTQLSLRLVRRDELVGETYHRGQVRAELLVRDTAVPAADGNVLEVLVELPADRLARMADFLAEYGRELSRWVHADPEHYDMPAAELPRRNGMTRAEEVWTAVQAGVDHATHCLTL